MNAFDCIQQRSSPVQMSRLFGETWNLGDVESKGCLNGDGAITRPSLCSPRQFLFPCSICLTLAPFVTLHVKLPVLCFNGILLIGFGGSKMCREPVRWGSSAQLVPSEARHRLDPLVATLLFAECALYLSYLSKSFSSTHGFLHQNRGL